MLAHWVPSTAIDVRIDAEFYRPEFVANEQRILRCAPCQRLDDLRDARRPITNGIRGPALDSTDYRMLRLQDIDELWIDSRNAIRVSEDQFRANRRAHCRPGDLLLAIGGYIGVVGKVVDDAHQTMGQHSARLSLDEAKIDPDFLLAFLASSSGATLCQRFVTGGVQAGINLEDVREIRVPCPPPDVQHAVGNKIRKAERHRAIARAREQEVRADIERLVGRPPSSDPQPAWVGPGLLNHRLDCHRYQAQYIETDRRVRKAPTGVVRTLEQVRDPDAPINNSLRDVSHAVHPSGRPIIRGTNLTTPWINPAAILRIDPRVEERSQRSRVKESDIVICIAGSLGAIGIVPRELDGANINSSCARLRVSPGIDPHYVAAFLSSDVGQVLLLRESVGSVQRHLNLEDIPEVSILLPPFAEQQAIGEKLRESQRNREQSRVVSAAARADVEALVDGKLKMAVLLAEGEEIERWIERQTGKPTTPATEGESYAS